MVERKVMLELTVKVTPPYPVFIGEDATQALVQQISESNVALIADERVYRLHGDRVEATLKAQNKRVVSYPFPGGETHKTISGLNGLLEALSENGFDRKCAVLALGGGITGDLAGFVAASYLRGVSFYNLPTTLLAMVDASVGGKTGVNLPQGKNLVGAFWQPKAVGMDLATLRTLAETEFRQGSVELFKHGLLADETILEATNHQDFNPKGDAAFLTDIIARSVKVKANIVAQDERESNIRAFLNLGHTLAHALEAASNHALPHGDAVAYGLLFNAHLSANRGWQDNVKTTCDFLHWVSPSPLPELSLSDLAPYFQRDKKTVDGTPRFVLLKRIGDPVVVNNVTNDELETAWQALKASL